MSDAFSVRLNPFWLIWSVFVNILLIIFCFPKPFFLLLLLLIFGLYNDFLKLKKKFGKIFRKIGPSLTLIPKASCLISCHLRTPKVSCQVSKKDTFKKILFSLESFLLLKKKKLNTYLFYIHNQIKFSSLWTQILQNHCELLSKSCWQRFITFIAYERERGLKIKPSTTQTAHKCSNYAIN